MKLRIARHTNKIEEITKFYTEVIGLEIIGRFSNHDGYDGVFFGKNNLDWHLEFTTSEDAAAHIWDEDDLIVFYPENENQHKNILQAIKEQNIRLYTPKNPYWGSNGILIKDPDDFGIVISNLK
jgi:catechol 2,3-dioxygenase-like lactoylglutathione lyase family enzyme